VTDHLEAVREAIGRNPSFDGGDRELVLELYGALADGETPTIEQLAKRLHRTVDDVTQVIDRCNVFYEDDAIVAFGGLSTTPTAHTFDVRGRRLYTWCAWDPLFIAPILHDDATVGSTCQVTGETISLIVGPNGVRAVSPASAVLSMTVPDESCTTDLVTNFCGSVLLFASPAAAETWTKGHPGTFAISLEEAFELGGKLVQQRAG
jgi:alkylmercury lyase